MHIVVCLPIPSTYPTSQHKHEQVGVHSLRGKKESAELACHKNYLHFQCQWNFLLQLLIWGDPISWLHTHLYTCTILWGSYSHWLLNTRLLPNMTLWFFGKSQVLPKEPAASFAVQPWDGQRNTCQETWFVFNQSLSSKSNIAFCVTCMYQSIMDFRKNFRE